VYNIVVMMLMMMLRLDSCYDVDGAEDYDDDGEVDDDVDGSW